MKQCNVCNIEKEYNDFHKAKKSPDGHSYTYKLNHYTNIQPLCSKINRDIKINKQVGLWK